jgi:tetratricopeptide (TPR) repeat protein
MDRSTRARGRRRFTAAAVACGVLVTGALLRADGRQALQNAASLVRQGRLDEAAQQAQLALADPEARAAAYSVLGSIRLQQQQLTDSARLFEAALKIEPGLPGAQINLAQVYVLQGKADRALDVLRRALTADPSLASAAASTWAGIPVVPVAASVKFALLLVDRGAVAEAIGLLERVKATSPPSYEVAFNLGSAYVLGKDPARALEAYDAALAVSPDALAALRQAAGIAEQKGELERSLSYWIRAKRVAPDDPDVLLGFGRVCWMMDLLEDAEPALEKAVQLRPDGLSQQYTLAAVKVGKRQFDAAQRLLEPLVAARPQDARLRYALGAVLYTQGHLDDAATHLKESARLDPTPPASQYYLALVTRDQGHEAEAMAMLERLVRQHPDHAGAHEALGGLQMGAQRYAEAEASLREAIRLSPGSVKANYQLGLLLVRSGKKDEGERQLAHAKTLREEDAATSRLQLRLLEGGR